VVGVGNVVERRVCLNHTAFYCGATTDINMEFTKSLSVGFFGGQGFVLQRLSGQGDVLVKGGGTIVEKLLEPGQSLTVSSGCIVAFEDTVSYDIQMMPGIKNAMFGGEGLFVAKLSGPGRVWLQGMPPVCFSSFVGAPLMHDVLLFWLTRFVTATSHFLVVHVRIE